MQQKCRDSTWKSRFEHDSIMISIDIFCLKDPGTPQNHLGTPPKTNIAPENGWLKY